MKPEDFPETATEPAGVGPDALKARIDADEDVFVLDTRARSDYEEWHIGGDELDSLNVPYFEFFEGVPEDAAAELPEDRPITVVCAKGLSSEFVAGRLLEVGYDARFLEDGMQGWARIYESAELATDGDATVLQYHRPSSGCLAYLVVSDGEAVVLDPLRAFADRYAVDAREYGADLVYAVDTHVHADHVSGVRAVAAESGATAVLPAPAAARGVEYDDASETVEDGEALPVGSAAIEAVHTPGHTTGMTTFRVGDVLFTGDGLFVDNVARPDLENPTAARDAAETLYDSLQERVLVHGDDALVAPGHVSEGAVAADDGTFTARLGDVVESVPVLSAEREDFVEAVASDVPPRPANHEDVIATNLGQQSPSDDEAFVLELGPNNCAAGPDASAEQGTESSGTPAETASEEGLAE